jgi:hypothetical protein
MRFQIGNPLHLSAPPAYEDALLSALAFFRQQPRETQALNCLAMYLRQSEARVMGELKFYAGLAGLAPQDLLMLIHTQPAQAEALLQGCLRPDETETTLNQNPPQTLDN